MTDGVSCFVCSKRQLHKDEMGLNKKMFGKNVKRLYCLECLSEHLEVTEDELLAKVEEFKEQGCTLF